MQGTGWLPWNGVDSSNNEKPPLPRPGAQELPKTGAGWGDLAIPLAFTMSLTRSYKKWQSTSREEARKSLLWCRHTGTTESWENNRNIEKNPPAPQTLQNEKLTLSYSWSKVCGAPNDYNNNWAEQWTRPVCTHTQVNFWKTKIKGNLKSSQRKNALKCSGTKVWISSMLSVRKKANQKILGPHPYSTERKKQSTQNSISSENVFQIWRQNK